jgi:hypothetical protein
MIPLYFVFILLSLAFFRSSFTPLPSPTVAATVSKIESPAYKRGEVCHTAADLGEVVGKRAKADVSMVGGLVVVDVGHQLHVILVLLVEFQLVAVTEIVAQRDQDHVVRK